MKKFNLSSDCVDFVNSCLQRNPEKRIGFNNPLEIMNHKWFKDVNWDAFLNMKIESPLKLYIPKVFRKYSENYCHNKYYVQTEHNYMDNDQNEKNLVKRLEHFGKDFKEIKFNNKKREDISSNSSYVLNLNPIHKNSLLYVMANYHHLKYKLTNSNVSKQAEKICLEQIDIINNNSKKSPEISNKSKSNLKENKIINKNNEYTFSYNNMNSPSSITKKKYDNNGEISNINEIQSDIISEESLIKNRNGLKRDMRQKLSELIKIQIKEIFHGFYYNKYVTFLKRKDDFINFSKNKNIKNKSTDFTSKNMMIGISTADSITIKKIKK